MKVSFRTRRNQYLYQETKYKFISFQIYKLWFAVPIHQVLKVIINENSVLEKVTSEKAITNYKGEEIVVLNVMKYLFNQNKNLNIMHRQQPHLLLFKNNYNDYTLGLPIDSQPKIIEAQKSNFKKLSEKCDQIGYITLYSNKAIKKENHPLYIILDPEKMIIH